MAWATWITREVRDEPEAGGGLMVAAIQLAIMLGASLGGFLLDRIAIGATFVGGIILLGSAAIVLSYDQRTRGVEDTQSREINPEDAVPARS